MLEFGEAKVSLPGGCAWGPRPVDFHIEGLKKARYRYKSRSRICDCKIKKMIGNKIVFPKISVGATGNVLMAAVLAEGQIQKFIMQQQNLRFNNYVCY